MPHKMDVIVDATTEAGEHNLTTQGMALLNLLACLGYDPLNPPLAHLLQQKHQLSGKWMIMSPVHWQATHNDAIITSAGSEVVVDDSLFNAYAQYLAEEELTLFCHSADLWLLGAPHLKAITAKPVTRILDQSLMPELATLDDSMFWQKFLTESQMFFASQTKPSAINGVWLWGSASLGALSSSPICVDEYFYDLASLCSNKVVLYTPSVNLSDYRILLVRQFDSVSPQHQEELKKYDTRWYWNNTAYTQARCGWFIRLWRTFFHAHKTTNSSATTH